MVNADMTKKRNRYDGTKRKSRYNNVEFPLCSSTVSDRCRGMQCEHVERHNSSSSIKLCVLRTIVAVTILVERKDN